MAIRPESILMSENPVSSRLKGTINKATYLGGHMEYTISTELGELFVIDKNIISPLGDNTSVGLSLANHGVTLVSDNNESE